MYFDAFTISALVDEFMDTIVGGRVQDVLDVDSTGIGLEIYAQRQRRYLYMSADSQTPRVHLVGDKLRRGLHKPTQLGLVFRRYVEGGIVSHVSQPAWERILQLDVDGPQGAITIIIEPMERRSNILLVQEGVIIDCMRRVGPDENRYRLSLPKHEYVPPPPMTGRLNPFALSLEDFQRIFEQNTDTKVKTVRWLSSRLLGISPLMAKEIVFRATGDVVQKAVDADIEPLYDALQILMQPLSKREWQAGIGVEGGVTTAFSVYLLTYFESWQSLETISEAIIAYYGAAVGEDAYNEAKKPVQVAIEDAIGKMQGKLVSLESGVKDDQEREILKQSGELILAYQYAIEAGQTELKAQYDVTQPELVIKLNPELSPLDNAQQYFSKYNKAKRALEDVPALIKDTKIEIAYLQQLEVDLRNAANWAEIDDVMQVLEKRGYLYNHKKVKRLGGGGNAGPLKITTPDGYVLWVGRNSRQNEQVTFKKANAQDVWLHARDVPGAHVVIRNDGRRITDDLIEQAAAVAAYYSSKRDDANVLVDYTRCKYVKSIKGAGAGMVTYRNEQTVTVTPQNEAIFNEKERL